MFKLRFTIDIQPRSKNGHPAHSTTGVARNSPIQPVLCIEITRPIGFPGIMSDIPKNKTGTVSATLTQKRRVIETNSGFSSCSATAVLGSSAMPQIGQDPGPSRTISGCMGKVYSIRVGSAEPAARSSAIPHFGQAPGRSWLTSGSIGQMYSAANTPESLFLGWGAFAESLSRATNPATIVFSLGG